MKKLLLKIFLMMAAAMGLVFSISRIALFVLQLDSTIDPKLMYYISLGSGLCGLILFAALLNLFVFRRIKTLSDGVEQVTRGKYDLRIPDNGRDELHTLIESFNAMTAELNANEYLNREYIKNISHELKTPLSSIIGYAELLIDSRIAQEEKQEYAQIILSESQRLLQLGGKMLELSRIDSHEIIRKDDCFFPAEQIRECVLLQQTHWQNKQIALSVELEDIQFQGNAELTRHIWENLISNAVKYCNTNGKIDIRLYQENGLRFVIANTGDGIAQADLPHIFQQFYTAHASSKDKGTGLGLALVKKIVDKLGGEIYCTCADMVAFTVVLYTEGLAS